jgi:hypothetical protein
VRLISALPLCLLLCCSPLEPTISAPARPPTALASRQDSPPTQAADLLRSHSAALALDGVDAFMSAPIARPDPFVREATLQVWVQFRELPSAAGRIFHIVGKSGFGRDLDLQAETDNRFHFYVATGAPDTVASRTTVTVGAWYRVVATYSASDRIALYVDDVREAERPIPGVVRKANTGPISVGENAVFNGRHFQGLIDDVALWARVLSDTEIVDAGQVDCRDPTLVAAYGFDGDTRDCSANHLDGQLGGGATYAPVGHGPRPRRQL